MIFNGKQGFTLLRCRYGNVICIATAAWMDLQQMDSWKLNVLEVKLLGFSVEKATSGTPGVFLGWILKLNFNLK